MGHPLGRSVEEFSRWLMEDDIENGTGGVAQPGAGASSSGGLTGNTNETPGDPLPASLHVEVDNVCSAFPSPRPPGLLSWLAMITLLKSSPAPPSVAHPSATRGSLPYLPLSRVPTFHFPSQNCLTKNTMTETTSDQANSPSSPPPRQPPRPHPSHPALAVSNINTFIKVTLDIEKDQYITWSELFKIHARAYQVLDHIIPPSAAEMKQDTSLQDTDPDLWSRVDAIVLQWIYGTISEDLLNTILERDSTAALAWNRLRDIFSDNKNSRALYLEQEFSKVQMEHFADASSYYQHLKSLSDQLSNVGSPVTNERLVLQLVSGLTDAYASIGSQIHHGDSLPPFYKARSMLSPILVAIRLEIHSTTAPITLPTEAPPPVIAEEVAVVLVVAKAEEGVVAVEASCTSNSTLHPGN
uniref:Retrovirus-related Pol polyprotein from transposon TNT 1-94 n=1 Tax=Populus alba TaxID=43335 RepID=A0A4U5PQ12_POPAL|nr:Retrovirus-related Pol polyprotein from transposon TNT 1-94 [Populus alba]